MGELKSVAGLVFTFTDKGFVSEDSRTLLSLLKRATEELARNNLLQSEAEYSRFEFMDGDCAYENLGYQGKELESYREFLAYLDEKRREQNVKYYDNCVSELMSLLPDKVNDFVARMIYDKQEHEQTYFRDMPILNLSLIHIS